MDKLIFTLADGNDICLRTDNYKLVFGKNDFGYGIYVADCDGVMYGNDRPAKLTVCGKAEDGEINSRDFSAAYESVTENNGEVTAAAGVRTELGTESLFTDRYYVTDTGVFALDRTVEIKKAAESECGFRSVYSLLDPRGAVSAEKHDFFVPCLVYKDSSNMVAFGRHKEKIYALFENLDVDSTHVRETRMGLPMAMLRSKERKDSVAIAHLHPKIDVHGIVGGGKNGEINSELEYASLGFTIKKGLSVDFIYPEKEGVPNIRVNLPPHEIFHPAEVGFRHGYSLSITPEKRETYAEAMMNTYQTAYMTERPHVTDEIDVDSIYADNIKLFTDTYKEFGTGNVISAGIPFAVRLADGGIFEYTFQMGFIGQQTSVGYNLLRQGYRDNDETLIYQGTKIVDFWTSPTIMSDAVPIVWWDPRDNETAGHTRGYPSFLRCFCDGMEGVLDAYRITKANGDEKEQWYEALVKVADFLADNQNEDGSFYRCYFTNGEVCTDTSNPCYQGTSKLNTPIAIRYLVKMYELTDDEKYRAAAMAAAEFSHKTLYLGLEKYVGGTPDNANTVDKEASIYALFGFNAIYAITKDERYLAAAEHAAASAMSWVCSYDYICPSRPERDAINPFRFEGRTSGFSTIGSGHYGADNYSADMYYDLFKLYVLTGKEFYLESAKLIQQNTKLSCDYDGKMGWKWRAIGPEASGICNFDFSGCDLWLPWSGIVNIKPIGYMEDTFGNGDIRKLDLTPEKLKAQLEEYGVGGKA